MAARDVSMASDLGPDDVDPGFFDHVGIAGAMVERAVRRSWIRREEGPRPLSGAVEAPDRPQRTVPELEEPFAVLIAHLLSDVQRGGSARVVVQPCDRLPDVVDRGVRSA